MSFAKTHSAQINGLKASIIKVETDITIGLYSFSLVGLPDKGVEESRDRVSAAIKNTGYTSPKSRNNKITVSLAPAEIRKEGPVFDLPIAISYLIASGDIVINLDDSLLIGELSLKGDLESIRGVLPIAEAARKAGFKKLYLPFENKEEAALVEDLEVYGVKTLRELIDHFEGTQPIVKAEVTQINYELPATHIDMREVKGQESAKRALLIAAVGGHNICMYGPPGTGKTMLAKSFASILPPLSRDQIFEVSGIHSIVGNRKLITYPPYRAPHHTASNVSLVGGGSTPKPGEITLAHHGVMFMDEFPEFSSETLEALREPLEDGKVTITRARGSVTYPARFILVAAMNPCPCGNAGNKDKQCVCRPLDIERYEKKISGPIMDRIDMWIQVSNIKYDDLSKLPDGLDSGTARSIIKKAREISTKRNSHNNINPSQIILNRDLNGSLIEKHVALAPEVTETLNTMARQFALSPRAYHRVLRVARTIADIDGAIDVSHNHIIEAFQYRPKVR